MSVTGGDDGGDEIMVPKADRTIWLYWESADGSPAPPIIQACAETFRRHAGDADVVVIDAESATRYSELLDPRWRSLEGINHRSDYLRSRVLYEHGGLFADIDTIALQDLSVCLDALEHMEVVGVRNAVGRPSAGFIGARRGSAAMKRWLDAQQRLLQETGFLVPAWNAIGSWQLKQALEGERVHWIESRHIKPIPYYDASLFLSSIHAPRETIPDEAIAANLYGTVYRPLWHVPYDELLDSDLLVSRVLRRGLGLSRPSDDWRPRDVLGRVQRLWRRGRRILSRLLRRIGLRRGG